MNKTLRWRVESEDDGKSRSILRSKFVDPLMHISLALFNINLDTKNEGLYLQFLSAFRRETISHPLL